MIISSTASFGKSYLVSAIAHLLSDACVLTGMTGMASFNICRTLHSPLQLPVRHTNQHSLQGTALRTLYAERYGYVINYATILPTWRNDISGHFGKFSLYTVLGESRSVRQISAHAQTKSSGLFQLHIQRQNTWLVLDLYRGTIV